VAGLAGFMFFFFSTQVKLLITNDTFLIFFKEQRNGQMQDFIALMVWLKPPLFFSRLLV
jgi:hypothetical protein